MPNTGKFIGIGVGPGDPELLIIKAVKTLKRVSVVAVPLPASSSESIALKIACSYLKSGAEVLRLPFAMIKDPAVRQEKRRAAAGKIAHYLDEGQDVAFLSEGDVMLYSTFCYLMDILGQKYEIEIIPGISSMMASAAQAQVPLALNHQHLAVIPATHTSLNDLSQVLNTFDTIVLLKISQVMETLIPLLEKNGLLGQAVVVENATLPDCRVVEDIEKIKNGQLTYMSQMIVSKNMRK